MDQFFTPDGRLIVPGTTVFISHASADAPAAQRLVAGIEEDGYRCWLAERDIHPGAVYSKALIEAIGVCGLFLLVLTRSAAESPHVRREIERAASRDKPFLVVRLDDVDPLEDDELSYYLSMHHWLDAREGSLEDVMPGIRNAIATALPTSARKPTPAPSTARGIAYVGIDVGSSKIAAATVLLDGPTILTTTVSEASEPITRPATARTLVAQIHAMAQRAINEQLEGVKPSGIGIALPGQVDPRGGALKFSPGLGLRNTPIKAGISALLPGVPIRIDNDTRCATRCELRLGAGLDYASLVCMFIGTGVGSGLAIDNKIIFGSEFCAGEGGHMKVDRSGPPCNCGQVGCLETFVNGPAVAAKAHAKVIEWGNRDRDTLLAEMGEHLTARDVARAADMGDEAALEVLAEVGTVLGVGIANYLNLLDPEAVILGGGLTSGLYLHLVGPISEAIERNALPQVRNTPILQSQYADTGAAIGAALLFHPDEAWSF
jgi:predicted NBD/HSP70 family sugar kinase